MATFYIDDEVEGILELTSTTSITSTEDSTATSHKVESGFNISDDVVVGNTKISFDGVVSDINGIKTITDFYTPVRPDTLQVGTNPYIAAIRRIKERKGVFSVIYDSEVGVVDNCVLTNFSITKDTSVGLGWKVKISFEQIRISNRSIITVNRTVERNSDKTQAKTDGGSTTTEKVGKGRTVGAQFGGAAIDGFAKGVDKVVEYFKKGG